MKKLLLLIGCFLLQNGAFAQEDSTETTEKITVSGYVKDMLSASFAKNQPTQLTNLIHNRLNFSAQISPKIKFVAGMRNRIFTGDQVTSAMIQSLKHDNGLVDLSFATNEKLNSTYSTTFDRAYFEFQHNADELRVGRQRVNWGVSLAWNPNDWFNSYNYFDFDYEERPGSDAVRWRHYFKDGMSSLDVATSWNYQKKNVTALLYKFNVGGYDLQLLTGKYFDDWAVGAGWAGNLGGAGFKGEVSYFYPFDKQISSKALVGTVSFDYAFKNSLYLNASWLYNSLGLNQPIETGGMAIPSINFSSFGTLTAKSLFPVKNTAMLMVNYPISPLMQAGLAGMYGFGMDLAFVGPSLSYSLKDNLDVYAIGQLFYLRLDDKMQNLGSGSYLRLKWSF